MADRYDSFQDAIDDISHGELVGLDEDETTKAEDSAAEDAREGESVTDAEQPEAQSDEDSEDSPPQQDEDDTEAGQDEESEPEEGDEAEDADTSDESDDEGDQTFEIDGETYTRAQLLEWRDNGLRQADYTRKTQNLAAEREKVESTVGLADEIAKDPAMKEFVRAHPEVMPKLLRDPKNTRAILGNADEVQKLWDRYELVQNDPELAERLVAGRTTDEDEAEAALAMRVENAGLIANHLDEVGKQIASEFEGVEWDDLGPQILQMARFPENPKAAPMETLEALERMYHIAFKTDAEGNSYADPEFLRAQFKQAQASASRKKTKADSEADKHNAAVDEALKEDAPPATKGGTPPAPEAERLSEASFDEIMAELQGYDG
jgi:hypothetical protein